MGEPTQRAPRTPGAARGMGNGAPSPAGAAAVPASPPVTPTRRKVPLVGPAVVVAADENTKLLSSGQKNGGRGEGGASGRGGAARSLLCGAATVVVLMLVGMAASELNLHMSKQRVSGAAGCCRCRRCTQGSALARTACHA